MTLEDPNTIDAISKIKNGKMWLGLTDAGVTTDPKERFKKLMVKLGVYVNFIMNKQFKKEYPGVKPKNVIIKVICANEPTKEMRQLDKVMPHGDRENMIKVEYEILKM